ncbi:homeobox protein cut-like 1 [Prionailurus viverrinus]|uniref:homeobox protein cut-like 1 n=1 Tax=Prionailurus viverrinus TaxID=61388 RepID=UPI001FF68F9A|nr:homeobox protein cut-like 1 [Prionailurus viverrinus]
MGDPASPSSAAAAGRPPDCPAPSAPGERRPEGRRRALGSPLHFPSPSPSPGARTCRAEPAGCARPPAPAGRERPPDTHLGRSGSWGPSRATRPRSRCGRQRAHAASTVAGRTRRHCPCCGESARGLPRPHRAGALPAAPFRLRRTILRSLRARPGAADLSQLAFAAQLSNIHLWGFSLAAPFHEPEKKNPFGGALESPRKASWGAVVRRVRDGPTGWHAVLRALGRVARSAARAESRAGWAARQLARRPQPAAMCWLLLLPVIDRPAHSRRVSSEPK